MKLAALPADSGACGLYRIINPIRALQTANWENLDAQVGSGLNVRFNKQGDVEYVPPMNDVDVLLLQRPMNKSLVQTIPHVQRQGVKVIVDLDDDIELTDPANAAYYQVNPATNKFQNWQWLKEACALADLVTVSTPALGRYAKHGRFAVLPNVVPEMLLTVQADPTVFRVGWSGTLAVHPHDLQVVGTAVASVVKETRCGFHVVGDERGVANALLLPEDAARQITSTGWVPLDRYPSALSTLSVGIVPLANTRFNQAKSCLKGLEMAALGIPFVATPTEDYRRLNSLGVGDLAKHSGDWYRKLKRLVTDESYRTDRAKSARAVVAAQCTLERNIHLWAEAWEGVLAGTRIGVS